MARRYHNLTSHYNSYYYSCEAIKDGVYKIEKSNKDNYEKVLPVFIYPAPDKAKTTFPDFDRAIKKSSLSIQRHSIKDGSGNEIPTAGKWIDNNWINIGISHFYKRDFFSAIEAFEYVVRAYSHSSDKYAAMLWLIKSYNEIGSVSSAEPIISLIKNEKHLPIAVRNEFPAVMADYYLRRGQYQEAIDQLKKCTANKNLFTGVSRKNRARYNFIMAQLYERINDHAKASKYYTQTMALKPSYEMSFYSKIKAARLSDAKKHNVQRIKKDLLKMTKELKNSDFYDVIYYTLGEIEEKESHLDKAINYYKMSVRTSSTNPAQKALSYLKLGEVNFDRTLYESAGAYYDSAVASLPKDHQDYEKILARKKTLEALVGHIRTVQREDSLQKIARMTENERASYIDKMIVKLKEEEERKQREQEAAKNNINNGSNAMPLPGGNTIPGFGGQSASFYFNNPNLVTIGIAEFAKKWGTRPLEDNWRRSNKTVISEDPNPDQKKSNDTLNPLKNPNLSAVKSREFYMKDLPLGDSAILKSNDKLIYAFYMMGCIYREELGNKPKSIQSFEELNRRFDPSKYQLNSYYTLYRIFQEEKNTPKEEYYKNKIINEYPNSEFALLIKNPDFAAELNTQKSEAEKFYSETYTTYASNDYRTALDKSNEGIKKYGKNDYLPRFMFIRSMCLGKLYGADTLEYSLKLLVAKYPNSEVSPFSNEVLLAIKKQKNPDAFKPIEASLTKTDTFKVNMDAEHFVVAILPDNSKKVDAFKINVGSFNGVYYGAKKFDITSAILSSQQIVLIKSFPSAKDAVSYSDNLVSDPDLFKEDIKKEDIIILLPVSAENVQILYKKNNVNAYKVFYEDNYKKLSTKN